MEIVQSNRPGTLGSAAEVVTLTVAIMQSCSCLAVSLFDASLSQKLSWAIGETRKPADVGLGSQTSTKPTGNTAK